MTGTRSSRTIRLWRRTGSGSSSPIAADWRIFLSYYVPNPSEPSPDATVQRVLQSAGKDDSIDAAEKLPWYAMEKLYPRADDIALAMDAQTGKTLC